MVSEPSIRGISSMKMVWATHGGSSCGQCPDQYGGDVHGGGARHLFDEMPSHREATPGGVLRVTVSQVLYPMNEEVLHQVFDAYGAEQVVVLERADHVEALVRFRSSRDAERARDVTHGRCVYDSCCWLDVQYMAPSDSIVATPTTFSTLELSHNTNVSMAATTSAAATLTTSTTSTAATTTFLVTGAREAPCHELKELALEETSKEPKETVQELCKKIIDTLNSMIESGRDVNLDISSNVVEPAGHYVVSLPTPPATGKWNDIIVSSPVPPVAVDSVRDTPRIKRPCPNVIASLPDLSTVHKEVASKGVANLQQNGLPRAFHSQESTTLKSRFGDNNDLKISQKLTMWSSGIYQEKNNIAAQRKLSSEGWMQMRRPEGYNKVLSAIQPPKDVQNPLCSFPSQISGNRSNTWNTINVHYPDQQVNHNIFPGTWSFMPPNTGFGMNQHNYRMMPDIAPFVDVNCIIAAAFGVADGHVRLSIEVLQVPWDPGDVKSICLYASRDATMCMSNGVIEGYDSKVELQPEHAGLPAGVTQKFPFISSYRAFRVPSSVDVAGLVKCQLVVSSFDVDGKHQDVTGLQLPGVLDDMFVYTGPLGAVFCEEAVSLYLWAPTAQDVSVCFYDGPVGPLLETLQLKELNGVWSVTGPKDWENWYYLYEVKVYHPSTSQIEKCLADDPYARGVSANGSRTWLVDIDSETLKPTSGDELADEKPNLDSFSDEGIYELHIRDFSAHNSTMDCNSQGGFREKIVPGFTVLDVDGEEPHTGIVTSISKDNMALVSCVDDERLGFQDGDLVVFSEVQGMTELNDVKPRKIKNARPYSFTLEEDTSSFGTYGGGIVTQSAKPQSKINVVFFQIQLKHPVHSPMDVGVENAVTPAAPSKVENGTPSAITLEEFEDWSALSKNDESTVSITVFGASGDLAKKKIFPSLFALYYEDCLPKHFTIFGYARSKMTDPELRNMVSRTLTCRIEKKENCSEKMEEFLKRCFYHSDQYDSEEHFMELAKKLKQHEGSRVSNRLFYLSIPPNIFLDVVKCASNSASSANGWTRVIVEKPFGRDLDTSAALTRGLKQYLVEDQIFRIDHYLGKKLEQVKIFETAWGQAAFQGGRNVMDRPGAEGFGHGPWAQEASESGVQESGTTATEVIEEKHREPILLHCCSSSRLLLPHL